MTTCKLSQLVSPVFAEAHRSIKAGEIGELVLKGGRGSAKSSYISVELVLQLLQHPDCHAAALRKVGNTLRTSVYAQVCWAIAELGLTARFKCTVSPLECVYRPTGQKIMFFGLDDPGKLKSIKVPFGYIGLAWFEELDQIDGPEQVRNVEQSLFRGGPYSFCFKSFNPPAMARNWANKYVLEPKAGRLVHHSTYLTTPPDWLGPRFLADAQHLKGANETAYRHEYLGEVVGSGTAVFENLRLEAIPDKQIAAFDYREFSKAAGLRTQYERTEVAGFGEKRREGAKPLDNPVENATITAGLTSGVSDLRKVCGLDIEKYKCVTPDITTEEVIITDERIQHIKDHHPGHFEMIEPFLSKAIQAPDYILADAPNTGLILKRIEKDGIRMQVVLRLHTSADSPQFKNSVISAWKISEARWKNYLRNKTILYKSE